MDKFIDTHTHSEFSPDSKTTVRELLLKAKEMNIAGVAITDHLDLDAPRDPRKFEFSIPLQQEAIEAAEAEIFPRGGCKVLKGIELGLQPCSIEHTREYISGCKFDQIIASVHFIDGEDPYWGTYYDGKDYRRAYSRALEVICQTAADFRDFDIIGHFDFAARYAPYSVKEITYAEFPDEMDALLKFMAQEGKAFEINTKTYSLEGASAWLPDTLILKRFKELGGEFVTLGSDSHASGRLCENFGFFAEMISRCGFEKPAYFENRKPHLYSY